MNAMEKNRRLIVVGDSAFAEVAYEYFTHDSPYEVAAFCVEKAYLKRENLFGLPVVAFEDVEATYSPETHDMFVAVVYTQLNRLRARLCAAAKAKGFRLASYVSSRAFVWRNVQMGEHCFIFEDNTVQPFVKIGDNVILWSGNHIGHHSVIQDHCFISSHVVISGFTNIGENCFLGVNSTVANNVSLGNDTWVGPAVTVMHDCEPGTLFKAAEGEVAKISALRFFRIREDNA